MKIAIGFYGITRSLRYTIDSINKKIFNIIDNNNIEYDVFMHSYNLINYSNKRTGEIINDTDIDNEEYKLLNAKYVIIDDQNEIKQQIDFLSYRTYPDPWNTDYNSVDNFILAQYSKLRLTNMIEKSNNNYDYIIFMRPDCLYHDDFQIDFLNLVENNKIVIPNFHLFGPYKFNDRFCITNSKTYKIYGEIFTQLFEMSKKQSLHSETIIGQIINNNNINIARIKFNFSRVRFFGIINAADKF